jgi:hypothetical protein
MKKSDLLKWSNDDVIEWLHTCKLEQFESTFKKYNIDGYTLIQLKEHDLEVHLKVESLGYRKNIIKHIFMLKTIWIRITGDSHGLNMSEHPSILGESWDIDQQSIL